MLKQVYSDSKIIDYHNTTLHQSHANNVVMSLFYLEHLLEYWYHLVFKDSLHYRKERQYILGLIKNQANDVHHHTLRVN